MLVTLGYPTLSCLPELEELGRAVALERQPGDAPKDRIKAAHKALQDSGGAHVVLDAVAIVGMFASITVMVDATGQRNTWLPKVAKVLRWIGRYQLQEHVLIGIFAVVGLFIARQAQINMNEQQELQQELQP